MSAATFGNLAPVLAENGYRPVPIRKGQKRPVPDGWQNYQFTEADAAKYRTCGVGIITGTVGAIDIDVRVPALAAKLRSIAEDTFGPMPARIGQAPKVALLFRADGGPFVKINTRAVRMPGDAPDDKAHKVEVLGLGQQLVAYGTHPDTNKPYLWNGGGDPVNVPAGLLPPITLQGIRDFIATAEKMLLEVGKPCGKLSEADDNRPRDNRDKSADELRASDPALLRQALAAIPNDDVDCDDWQRIGMAIKGALGDGGRADFLAWSAKSVKDVPETTAKAWESFDPRRIGAGTIYFLAGRNGWTRPGREAGVQLADFHAYMPMHQYIFAPSGEMWPSSSVNSRLPPQTTEDGKAMKASDWLDAHQPVEQLTWFPGEPALIEGRLISNGGWIERPGCRCFNLYRPPQIALGRAGDAGPWVEHVRKVYPDDADHIIGWLAHRRQRPSEKINHALVLGGWQGIGKDTILEPIKYAVGPWNFADVAPGHLLGRFNGFVRSVILRVSEARDLGDTDRYAFYDHMKVYTAAPPDVLRCDEKNIREYAVPNVTSVIITSNHKQDGIYLPNDDRRHYVAWSDLTRDAFTSDYWTRLYRWYERGGHEHVAAYLEQLDLAKFDPKAPPPRTPAFYDIVDANRAPEDSELADILDILKNPQAITVEMLAEKARHTREDFHAWLTDRKNRRQIPHRLESAGYVPVRNTADKRDGQWKVNERRQTVYASRHLSVADRHRAVAELLRRSSR
jgi:hypothetical protein